MPKPWLHNGKPVMKNGKPILCDRCPCGEEPPMDCSSRVDAYVQQRLAEIDPESQLPVWEVEYEYATDFQCSIWEQVSDSDSSTPNEWSLVAPSQGNLVVVVPRRLDVESTLDSLLYHDNYVHATELVNVITGEHRVVGCRCNFDSATRSCSLGFGVSEWASAIGYIPVRAPRLVEDSTSDSQSDSQEHWEYGVEDVCEVDDCERYKTTLEAYQLWFGGYLYGEGYLDKWLADVPSSWWDSVDWSGWSHYYWFRKHVACWLYCDEGSESDDPVYRYAYVPCECDSIVTGGYYTDGVMVHEYEGICDLEGDCQMHILMWLRRYEDEEFSTSDTSESVSESDLCGNPHGASKWEEVASATGDYTCPVWHEEEGEWVLDEPASGNLVTVFPRTASLDANPEHWWGAEIEEGLFTTAITIRNKETGEYRTLGCRCDDGDHSCTTQFSNVADSCVGGTLPTFAGGTTCSVDKCDLIDQYIERAGEWYEGNAENECIIDNAYCYREEAVYEYTAYRRLLWWRSAESDSDSNGYIYAIGSLCSCQHESTRAEDVSIRGMIVGENSRICPCQGICSATCGWDLALRASATVRGWTIHGSGILVHLKSRYVESREYFQYYYPFEWYQSKAFKMIVEGDDGWRCLRCDCSGLDGVCKNEIEGYWAFIPWNVENGCDCVDARKLLLDYPDMFGVVDYSYGSNTTYEYTTSQGTGTYIVQAGRGLVHFLDFRTICFILEHWDNQQLLVWLSPSGSPFYSQMEDTYAYDTITFTGHHPMFSRFVYTNPDGTTGNFDFAGNNFFYQGTWGECDTEFPGQIEECFGDYQSAYDFAHEASWESVSDWGETSHANWYYYPYVDMNGGVCAYHPADVWEDYIGDYPDDYEVVYCGTQEMREKGQCVNGMNGTTPSLAGYIYHIQWLQTNKGIAINGLPGFYETFVKKGALDHQEYFCQATISQYTQHDSTITASNLDESMHWCDGNEPDESESEESES